MLVHYHGEGNEQDPVVRLEYEEITQALHAESEVNSIWAVAGAIVTGTPAVRKRIFIMVWAAICSQMSGNAFVSY